MQATHSIWDLVPYAELIRPRHGESQQARIESIVTELPDVRTITFKPSRRLAHRAGQFVKVGVEVDGRILTRTYSITSPEERDDGCLSITVKAIFGGRVSNALVYGARRGDMVTLGVPQGDFVLPQRTPRQILFVTGGSGVTPILGMLRTLADDALVDVVHVQYAKTAREVLFDRELGRLAQDQPDYRRIVVLTREGGAHLDATTLEAMVPDWRSRETWACGPESLLLAVTTHISERIHVERFRAKLAPAPEGAGGRVRFGRSKKELDASGATSLLQVAEHAGVDAPHGCRMGICHSCDATMVSGCVRDMRNGNTIDEPGTRVQLCICAAQSDVEIDL